MRATSIVSLGLILMLLPSGAGAEDRCVWADPGKKPRLFVDDRLVIFRQYYAPQWAACAVAHGSKDFEVQWIVGSDTRAIPVETDKVQLYAGKEDGPRKLETKLFPNHICDEKANKRPLGKLVTTGPPGKEKVSEMVEVRVRVVATGTLAPLAYNGPPVLVPCSACTARGGKSFWIRQADNGKDLFLEAEADREWFECAGRGATLMLLAFGGKTNADVENAIRPDLTIAALEKEFSRRDDKYILRKPLPMSRLCAHETKYWSFELWGQGELMHMGGGRFTQELRCK